MRARFSYSLPFVGSPTHSRGGALRVISRVLDVLVTNFLRTIRFRSRAGAPRYLAKYLAIALPLGSTRAREKEREGKGEGAAKPE
jgi:hypothetical protein